MLYTLKIQKLLNQVEETTIPEEKIKHLLQAVRIADDNEDIEWGYDLRLMLIEEERDVAFSRESIPAFAWVLKACDDNPDLFSETDFLWQYKWMMSDLYDNPLVPLEQLHAALNDFKIRLQRNGYGLRAYYNELYSDALIQKDPGLIREIAGQLKAVERDAMSDCQACEMDADVNAILELEGFEQGREQAIPLLEKQYTCVHVPMRTLVNLSYYAYKNDEPDLARDFADKAAIELEKLVNDSSAIFSEIKLQVCKVAQNPAIVKERLEQLIPKVVGNKNRKMFQMTVSLLEILPQFSQDTIFDLILPEEHDLYAGKTVYTRDELIDYFSKEAREIAHLFDQRNGNQNFGKQVEKVL